jgi:hypothetical protein
MMRVRGRARVAVARRPLAATAPAEEVGGGRGRAVRRLIVGRGKRAASVLSLGFAGVFLLFWSVACGKHDARVESFAQALEAALRSLELGGSVTVPVPPLGEAEWFVLINGQYPRRSSQRCAVFDSSEAGHRTRRGERASGSAVILGESERGPRESDVWSRRPPHARRQSCGDRGTLRQSCRSVCATPGTNRRAGSALEPEMCRIGVDRVTSEHRANQVSCVT